MGAVTYETHAANVENVAISPVDMPKNFEVKPANEAETIGTNSPAKTNRSPTLLTSER